MMNQKVLTVLVTIAIVLSAFSLFYSTKSSPKIGYVRSADLFQGYLGMKEAKTKYEIKVNAWQANFDTLSKDYQTSLSKFNLDYGKLSAQEKQERKLLLQSQMQNLERYKETIEEKVSKEDEALTEGVYNQINTYIKQYGEAQGYTVIMGTGNGGIILYGKEHADITNDVLKGLNDTYKGLSQKP